GNTKTMSSCTSVPRQKQRRSSRRSGLTSGRDSQALSALGDFQTLPLEIFQMVLNYLSVKDISMLSMVSKTISGRLINYISTSSGSRRLLLQDFHRPELPARREGASILEHYKALGLLLKRCTLLLPTRDRLKYVHKVLAGVSCFKLNGCASPLHCLGLQCYGVFLQILTAGWDELECHRVFNFLWELSNLARKVQTVVSSKPGSARRLELRIRLYCRGVLLSPGSHRSDCAFWLTRILKPWPMVNQARLLYIIFGPVSSRDGEKRGAPGEEIPPKNVIWGRGVMGWVGRVWQGYLQMCRAVGIPKKGISCVIWSIKKGFIHIDAPPHPQFPDKN
uniref:F-box protein 47 n=1 Tax=Cyanistes caeruleus TaxID=156563 RepID=A0A8C0VIP6_CYACU